MMLTVTDQQDTPVTGHRHHIPCNMFLYHVKTSSSDTLGGPRDLSTNSPSEPITRNVGIAGRSDALRKDISAVNLLLMAPGKWTLHQNCISVCPLLRAVALLTDPSQAAVRLSFPIFARGASVLTRQPLGYALLPKAGVV